MLAYLLWHRPSAEASRETYEQRLVDFHAALRHEGLETASFRLEHLPFSSGSGYEDWYLVEDWAAIGALGDVALRGAHGSRHDAVALLSAESWGGVYGLVRGDRRPPAGARWAAKGPEESLDSFLEREGAQTLWRRQLVLGPAAEFCLGEEATRGRARVWPS
jgi:hypothetical protein